MTGLNVHNITYYVPNNRRARASRTFGKGLVQKIVPLPYDSALKYTVAKYFTSSGRCIQAVKYKGQRG